MKGFLGPRKKGRSKSLYEQRPLYTHPADMCRGSYTAVISPRMTLDPLLPALQHPSYVELDKACAKPGTKAGKAQCVGSHLAPSDPRGSQPGIIVTDMTNGEIQYIDQFADEALLEAKHPILAAIEHRKTECGKADHTGLSLKLERSQDVTRIEPAEGTEKSPVYKRSKSLLSRRSDCSGTKPQGYKAVNVRAVGRTSEAFAQCINLKEDKRLVARLTSLDREKTVFSNSVTRDEKVLLQRSKALANVMSKRELKRGRSCEAERSRTQESGADFLYGVKIVRREESQNELRLRRLEENKSRQNWATTVSAIMQRDIKTWHRNYLKTLKSPKQRTRVETLQPTLEYPPPIPSQSSCGTLPLKRYLVQSQQIVDKGDWITNYINTSCTQYLPNL